MKILPENVKQCVVLLDLPEDFSENQLSEAYRDMAHVWHPDKHRNNDRLLKRAENKMKEINEAYAILKAWHKDSLSENKIQSAPRENVYQRDTPSHEQFWRSAQNSNPAESVNSPDQKSPPKPSQNESQTGDEWSVDDGYTHYNGIPIIPTLFAIGAIILAVYCVIWQLGH